MSAETGALLVNLGTPRSPRPRDVRRYLREFLSDPLVLDMPAAARWLLLHAVILPFRPRRSAAAYAKIWTDEGSPLLVHGRALRSAVAERLGDDFAVELAMRYGEPAIGGALDRLAAAGVRRIVALPLYPQYSLAATESTVQEVTRAARRARAPEVAFLPPFYDAPGFLGATARLARERLEAFRPDFVLMSYHGLPERQVRRTDRTGRHCLEREDCCAAVSAANRDCYRAQCFATTRALAAALALPPERTGTAFQSRLGRTPWIEPYTDRVLPELAARGVRRLAVLCPSFVADCLETIEEIGIRAREQWASCGGESLLLVPCVNAEPDWADAVAQMFRQASSRAARIPDAAASATEMPSR